MASANDLITRIRRVLVDESDTNYQDAELVQYINDALDYLSREMARWNNRIGMLNTTLSYAQYAYSDDLPPSFLSLATNEDGLPRVFNASNSYNRLTMVDINSMDDWENETNSDAGTVEEFVILGPYMYVHPRASATTTIKIYYHKLEAIADASSTMPWWNLFDKAIEAFVIRQCRMRSEMFNYSGADVADYERLKAIAWDILQLRENNYPQMRPSAGVGWTT